MATKSINGREGNKYNYVTLEILYNHVDGMENCTYLVPDTCIYEYIPLSGW